ncbi:MAG: hypothetical protein ABSG42_02070 [Nitrospirota bacterium]
MTKSYAVPSLARQTGLTCDDCHTIYPELTPLGRSVKLHGYVQTREDKPAFFVPVCLVATASYTAADVSSSGTKLTNGVAPFDSSNNNGTDRTGLPQAVSAFYGGKIYDNLGAILQVTYDGTSNSIFLDNTDVRYAYKFNLFGKELICGATVNNNPTVQDVWNSTPAWGFPYNASSVALTPAASPLITVIGQQVGGIGGYFYWNDLVYLEGSVYRTTKNGITMPLGAGNTPPGIVVDGALPYWRLVLQHNWGNHSLAVGTYGISADVFPAGLSHGPTDNFLDAAADLQYQYIGTSNIVSVESTFIHERQKWEASFAQGLTANPIDRLNTFRANVSYVYRTHSRWGDIGGTTAYFYTSGDRDTGIFAPAQFTGSSNGKPDNNGVILEADYLPWEKTKFAAQYTIYNKFNGGSTNYDGSGTNAAHNNTFYLYAQFSL